MKVNDKQRPTNICPLAGRVCLELDCAWFDAGNSGCYILTIAALKDIEEIEAEIKRREPEVDDLYCLAHYGKHRAELIQENTVKWRSMSGLEYKPHWPGNGG